MTGPYNTVDSSPSWLSAYNEDNREVLRTIVHFQLGVALTIRTFRPLPQNKINKEKYHLHPHPLRKGGTIKPLTIQSESEVLSLVEIGTRQEDISADSK